MRILSRYVLREFLVPLFYCLAGFLGIYVLFELFDSFNRLMEARPPFLEVVAFFAGYVSPYLEWLFPAALLLSADCYAALGEYHRARDVYYEVAMLFPNTDWGEDALEGLRRVMEGKKTAEKEQTALEDVFFNVTEDMNALAEELLKKKKLKEILMQVNVTAFI